MVIATQPVDKAIDSNEFDSLIFLKRKDGTWSNPSDADSQIWNLPRPLRSFSGELTSTQVSRFKSTIINLGILRDVNADGLIDIVYSHDLFTDEQQNQGSFRKTVSETYLNTGNGWVLSQEYSPRDVMFDYISNTSGSGINLSRVETNRSVLIDVNGDRLLDWVSAYNVYGANGTSIENQSTWLNNGQGWNSQPTASYALPDVFIEYTNGFTIEHGQFVDVNGDGLPDWVQAYSKFDGSSSPINRRNTWLNTGEGWESEPAFDFRLPGFLYSNILPLTQAAAANLASFVDVNGDGLQDFVVSFAMKNENLEIIDGGTATFINTGQGWQLNEGYQPEFVHIDNARTFGFNLPLRQLGLYIDLNRDGLVDYLSSFTDRYFLEGQTPFTSQRAWINTGSEWVEEPAGSPYIPDEVIYDYQHILEGFREAESSNLSLDENNFLRASRSARIQRAHMVDINNDGISDWVFNHTIEGENNTDKLVTKIAPENAVEQLRSIKTTSGVLIKPTFMPLTSSEELYVKGTGEPEEAAANSISAAYVVSQVETSRPDGIGFNSVVYQYEGAQINRSGRGFLGFKSVTATSVERGTTSYTEYRQDFPFIGMVERSATMVGDKTINAIHNEYDFREVQHTLTQETTFVPFLKKTTSFADEIQSSINVPFNNQVSEFTYDNLGNRLTTNIEIKDAFGNLIKEINTTTSYVSPIITTTGQFLNLARETTITTRLPATEEQQEELAASSVSFQYDDRGQVVSTVYEPNSEFELIKTNKYDVFGNIVEESLSSNQDGERVTQYEFDSQGLLPILTVNAKGQTLSTDYDPICDSPSEVTDMNGLVTTNEYDNFCRQARTTSPQGTVSEVSYSLGGANNNCFQCQTNAAFVTTQTVADEPPISVYLNAFNLPMLATTTGMLGEGINIRYEYDFLGRTSRESQPFFDNDIEYYTSYEYDQLDRRIKTTFAFQNESGANATQLQTFMVDQSGRRELISTDTKGRNTHAFSNALSQIEEVLDVTGSSLYYEFNAQGNLARTVAAADPNDTSTNIITSITYDKLGRRISLDDPDLGLTTYQYNDFGELISQTDAKQQTITRKYDELGRLIEQTVPDVPGSNSGGISTWVYDVGQNAIGQLSSVTGPNGYVRTYNYDEFSRLSRDVSIIRGETYEQSYGYDQEGRVAFKRYPDSGNGNEFAVHYNYVNGYLSTITDRSAGLDNCIEHWRANKYDALGRLANETLGKIVNTEYSFDAAQGVLNSINSSLNFGGLEPVQSLDYTYDATSNLLSRADNVLLTNESFEYDQRDRLRFHYKDGADSVEARYDAIGNITYKSNVGTYSYSGDGGPHAVSRIELPLDAQTSFERFQVNWEWDGEQFLRSLPSIHGQNFSYDENGNTEQSGNRSLFWTAFDKPYLMLAQTANGNQIGSYIEYDASQQRIYKEEGVYSSTGQLSNVRERTVYIGGGYQRITDQSGGITHRYTIATLGNVIQIDRDNNTSFDRPQYQLADSLGSTNVILNALGEVEQRLAFDPWGMRVNTGDQNSVNKLTNRGFTGHEMDDETGLINANARIYDPYLGRFLSPDPVLQDPSDLQSYNRYTYVFNNPLKYVDPSGNTATFTSTTINVIGVQFGAASSNAIPSVSVSVSQQITQFFSGGGSISLGGGLGFGDESGFGFGASFSSFAFFTDINITISIIIDFTNAVGGGGPTGSSCTAGACNILSSVFGTDGAANNNDFLIFRLGDFTGGNREQVENAFPSQFEEFDRREQSILASIDLVTGTFASESLPGLFLQLVIIERARERFIDRVNESCSTGCDVEGETASEVIELNGFVLGSTIDVLGTVIGNGSIPVSGRVVTLGGRSVTAVPRAANGARRFPDGSFRTPDGKFASGGGGIVPGAQKADDFADFLSKNGFDVVGRELEVLTATGVRRLDIVVRDARGVLQGIEVKSGTASANATQRFKDRVINLLGATGRGRIRGEIVESVTTVFVP